uniref:Crossover junction endonuclease MUS81 n=1 Tax=Kalanchoe fedtschenkoi TaxID=63787 RepID=A0A7N0VDP7_KALFE
MEYRREVTCRENEELVTYLLGKRQELADAPKGISDKLDGTLRKAYVNICDSTVPITNLKDLSRVKGVGNWMLKLMQDFFKADPVASDSEESPEDLRQRGKKGDKFRHYVPKKNSVAFALIITLYRGTPNADDFMRKQELIDAAESSGLSRVSIMGDKGKGNSGKFGSSPRDWYTGWSCMKTLVSRGLVVKSSCPAKYMLTQEGREVARECLMRSGLDEASEDLNRGEVANDEEEMISVSEKEISNSDRQVSSQAVSLSGQEKNLHLPPETIERCARLGYSKEEVVHAFVDVAKTSVSKDVASLWPAVLCHLREAEVYGRLDSRKENTKADCGPAARLTSPSDPLSSFTLRACQSMAGLNANVLSMPPLSIGERFEDAYQVILILDDREQFAAQGSRSRKIIDNICSQFKIQIEVRRLPVGDGIWIARHKYLASEYVLDFIVERKNVDDLRCSIRDKRYRDQKLRLQRCGVRKLIYLVEGDPNTSEASDSIKTACLTTEILEGFDVQRTSGLADTLRKYGHLTQAIAHVYKVSKANGICPQFKDFMERCNDLDKMTVADVFGIQLMQVPGVTEEIAVSILDLYPTLFSLARAYSLLEGDMVAQEEMLRNQSSLVSSTASKNIFQLVWGN